MSKTRDFRHRTMLHDRYAPFQRLAMVQVQPPPNPNKPLTPFSISDILNGRVGRRTSSSSGARGAEHARSRQATVNHHHHHSNHHHLPPHHHLAVHLPSDSRLFRTHPLRVRTPVAPAPDPRRFLRPWDDSTSRCSSASEENDEEIDIEDEKPPRAKSGVSPLDALFQMTTKTFDGRNEEGELDDDGAKRDQLSLFSKSQPSKKRRKSRTAFSNQQIYELEKRFLYQKYLTPADRDEIAQSLGLTNAQVITWFQNRRAKLKRDLEELKADVTAAHVVSPEADDNELLDNVDKLNELPIFQHDLKHNGKQSSEMSAAAKIIASKTDASLTVIEKSASDVNKMDSNSEQDKSEYSRTAHAQSPDPCVTSLSSPDSTTQIRETTNESEAGRHVAMETSRDSDDDQNVEIEVQ